MEQIYFVIIGNGQQNNFIAMFGSQAQVIDIVIGREREREEKTNV